MLLTKRNCLIASGPIALGFALGTFGIDGSYSYRDYAVFLNMLRGLQVMSTASLLFGLLKKEPLHKDKFVLFWLLTTSFLFGFLSYFTILYIGQDLFNFYDFWDFLLQLLGLFGIMGATALLGYMLHFVYGTYVEFRKDNLPTAVAPLQATTPVMETKDVLPSYDQLNVTIQN
ncbi:uncharacterized protein LOC111602350 [Drosophila hydei]|uniref:Uncharacterized protein LOC111602350 n=1 Tax=Drosophila hydei TaxID=7224 RepID=A0A6J1M9E2_DROHY|nr:uncharacterized protein LOC111602350 [Drosophila hydei]